MPTFRNLGAPGGDQAHLLTEDQSPDHDPVAVEPQPSDARVQARVREDAEILRKVSDGEKLTPLEKVRHRWLEGRRSLPVPREVMSVV